MRLFPAVLVLACCTNTAPFPAAEQARFDTALTDMQTEQQCPGALLLVSDGQHRYASAIGMADIESGRAMTIDTPYRTASMSKTFVGALILALQEEGKLSVDDPVSEHIDGIPNGENITLSMLLTHTSGIANYNKVTAYLEAAEADHDRVFAYQELIDFAVAAGPDFPPGTTWNYSNTGYILLGMIAEQIAGRSLYDELRARWFDRLGMTHTHPLDGRNPGPDLARAYLVSGSSVVESNTVLAINNYAADGGWVTTLGDIDIWSRNFLAGRLHQPETLARARMSEGGELLDSVARAFGFDSGGYARGFVVAHDGTLGPLYAGAGNGDGERTMVGYLPDSGISYALFVNVGDGQVPIVETLSAARPVIGALRAHVDGE
jgi:D-alanyl-D-alanine carboxypeptidase